MNFLIISHVLHKKQKNKLFAYAPYVREMNLWLKHVDSVTIVSPLAKNEELTPIDIPYQHENININTIPQIQFTSIKTLMVSLFKLPTILYAIFKACKRADHIHLRCPGNIGLLGCIVQICFPKKIKTAKYAGNWDPKSKQPLSYRFQKWLLSNSFLTKNMHVLVYGHWENKTKNVKPFFTASFSEKDRVKIEKREYNNRLHFVFIGTLVKGKRPLFAIKLVEQLKKEGKNVFLEFYGEGPLKKELNDYVIKNGLGNVVEFKGNQDASIVKEILKKAHFLILASKSEGWPKAIAEAMFFGTIPIATKVSCVPFMLDYGKRGILIEHNLESAVKKILESLKNYDLKLMSILASNWSQNYTLDVFETEVAKLLNS
ncbi:glycosyltransferase [Hwangdonia lutea]|uniref:Glycosyltransferase n=1 Tax=Hwangdonia lutea TaxID=3075823 RepID=A0AA97EMC8_9FLAO|nr:glycosyltransferase [Hwangdonia sp. SCSIO 19198]WOD43962.1 glycosyltransferase [Hwangdonia sp. SCSIO 19198]